MNGIWKFQAWMDAATQIFYSLSIGFGALIAFSSYMPRKNNCVRDALTVVLINCGTSLFAGIVTFSFLGYRKKVTGIPIEEVRIIRYSFSSFVIIGNGVLRLEYLQSKTKILLAKTPKNSSHPLKLMLTRNLVWLVEALKEFSKFWLV